MGKSSVRHPHVRNFILVNQIAFTEEKDILLIAKSSVVKNVSRHKINKSKSCGFTEITKSCKSKRCGFTRITSWQ